MILRTSENQNFNLLKNFDSISPKKITTTTNLLINNDFFFKLNKNKLLNPRLVIEKKLNHTLAALEFFQLLLENQLTLDCIYSILIFEITQVDFADNLGETKIFKDYKLQIKLFENLKDAIVNEKYNYLLNLGNIPLDYRNHIISWENYLFYLIKIFNKIIQKYPLWNKLKPLVERRLIEYYHSIALDHMHNKPEEKIIKSYLIKKTYKRHLRIWKNTPKWVKHTDLWFNFLGDSISFLSPIFFSIELPKRVDYNFTLMMFKSYRAVGVLNVFLDDLLDIDEDKKEGGINLIDQLLKNKYNQDFDLDPKTTNDEKLIIVLNKIINTIKSDIYYFSKKVNNKLLFIKLNLIIKSMLSFYYYLGKFNNNKIIYLIENYLKLNATE